MKTVETPAENRLVAGLYCLDVLDKLSAFVDGELEGAELAQVRAHVAACSTCERFGGRFAEAVNKLRETADPPLDPAIDARLAEKLGLI